MIERFTLIATTAEEFSSGVEQRDSLEELALRGHVTDTLTSARTSSAREAEKRRSSRMMLSVPITVSGIDALGEPFRELTTTLSVSCNGCKYRSKNYVQRDSLVTIEVSHPNPRLSPRVVRGRARWVQRPRNLREQYEVALELEVPGNIWGIASPPPDWFAHPDDEKLADPAAPAVGGSVAEPIAAESTGTDAPADSEQLDTSAELPRMLVPVATFEEIDLVGAIGFTPDEEESTPAPVDLNERLQEAIGASLKAMVDRMAEAAAMDIAARIAEVIEEVRATCDTTAEEFEGKIRGALDEVLSPQQIVALTTSVDKQARKRARKAARKKARAQAAEAENNTE